MVQCDGRIAEILRRDVLLVMHVYRRHDQALAQTDLTQSALLLQERRPTLPPCCRSVEALDVRIMMHPWTLLAISGVRPAAGKGETPPPPQK